MVLQKWVVGQIVACIVGNTFLAQSYLPSYYVAL